ncbi:ZIP family metal transporter [Candidatus Woesearchaeota archaeon]|nr:MAG: ZIP family metal transporter [Candidatus Woesearchaeota archaeon]
MYEPLWYALIASLVVSLLSLVGVFFLSIKEKTLSKILLHLVGFSAGALIGGAFLHLIPEIVEESSGISVFIYLIIGIGVFFILERLIHWHHCHEEICEVHTFTYMNLVGDSIHNFLDGIVIATAFLVDVHLGIVTTIVIIAHELPQEIGDFGVLLHGGWSKGKALFWNFMTAITAIIGALLGFFLSTKIEHFNSFLIPFAAGGFIYIAMSDLIPELHKEQQISKALVHFGFFALGVGLMLAIKLLGVE